ncbi:MAG: phosphoesterase [Ilumatobacteraceae bacterium]|nr:phosphoesterase [Ilumatobacteraceae bacterium]
MENKDTGAVLGSPQAPFLGEIAAACGTATDYVDHGIHPSLPNYLVATSGDRHGITDDAGPATHPLDVDNIFRQVRATGQRAMTYAESMPANCSLTTTDLYAARHNPATYYVGGDDRPACERDDVPFARFASDLAGGVLPAFAMIVPDICNDMHSCPIGTGDAWLRQVVGSIVSSATYRQGATAIFVVFDESEGRGTMPFVAIAPAIGPGTQVTTQLDHVALLHFTEDALGITDHLGGPSASPTLASAFAL